MTDLTGKTALVTGGNRGIGGAIAVALARAGADVALTYRAREREALETGGRIEALGRRAVVVQADVSVAADVTRMVAAVSDRLGDVAVLVNNAGIVRPQAIDAITERDWDELIAVNLTSVFRVTQAVLPSMRRRMWGLHPTAHKTRGGDPGRIINLSSVAAQLGGVVGPHYAASKAGVLGLTHSYAALLAKEGITVNTIAPALVRPKWSRATRVRVPTSFRSDDSAKWTRWLARR